jgi:hypothetical protein
MRFASPYVVRLCSSTERRRRRLLQLQTHPLLLHIIPSEFLKPPVMGGHEMDLSDLSPA